MSLDQSELLANMIRIRVFEERCAELYGQSKIRGFLHLYIGEEAVAVGTISQLEPEDAVLGTYREHGHALLRGIPADHIMAEMFGKATGCSGGRGGSMHLFDIERRFFGGNAIVGGHLPLAVGLALADKMQGRTGPALKASNYRMPAWTIDGMDVDAVVGGVGNALATIRGGGGPVFLEFLTYRFRAHSMFDPDIYRDPAEIERWRERDPIDTYAAKLMAEGPISETDLELMWEKARAETEEAVRVAEQAEFEPVEDLLLHVYGLSGVAGSSVEGQVPP